MDYEEEDGIEVEVSPEQLPGYFGSSLVGFLLLSAADIFQKLMLTALKIAYQGTHSQDLIANLTTFPLHFSLSPVIIFLLLTKTH